jgi:hypothetical protein
MAPTPAQAGMWALINETGGTVECWIDRSDRDRPKNAILTNGMGLHMHLDDDTFRGLVGRGLFTESEGTTEHHRVYTPKREKD